MPSDRNDIRTAIVFVHEMTHVFQMWDWYSFVGDADSRKAFKAMQIPESMYNVSDSDFPQAKYPNGNNALERATLAAEKLTTEWIAKEKKIKVADVALTKEQKMNVKYYVKTEYPAFRNEIVF